MAVTVKLNVGDVISREITITRCTSREVVCQIVHESGGLAYREVFSRSEFEMMIKYHGGYKLNGAEPARLPRSMVYDKILAVSTKKRGRTP